MLVGRGESLHLDLNDAQISRDEEYSPSRAGCLRWFVREGRLRSGWRVLLYLVIARLVDLVGQLALGIALVLLIGLPLAQSGVPASEIQSRLVGMFTNILDVPWLALSVEGERVVMVLLVVWVFRRLIDRRTFQSLGLQPVSGWWAQLIGGFAFSLVGWGIVFLLALSFGATTITGFEWSTSGAVGVLGALALGIAFNLLVGIAEELDARGYMLQNLAEGIRLGPAIVVSSLYFGILHLLNPGAGFASTLGIFFAGVLLALGYYATGQLWFSIGMHAGWNFAEGPLFGFPVSGLDMGGVFHLHISAPDWLMGGAFGPEAGALAIGVEVVMIAVIWLWGKRRRTEGNLQGQEQRALG